MALLQRLSQAPLGLAIPVALACVAPAHADVSPPAGCTGTPTNTWVTVIADDFRNSDGLLAVTVYVDDSKRFLIKGGSIFVGRVKVQPGNTRACVFLPKPGVYALALYHDENANQKFDRSGLGLPKEGWGFTNNPATLMGLPTFNSVRIDIPHTGLVTRIHMKYP